MSYAEFLAAKSITHSATGIPGFSTRDLDHTRLKPFQRDCTTWALQKGRCALFQECGLGKTWQALWWAQMVMLHTNKPVLILTPLAVAQQFIREGAKNALTVLDSRNPEPQREYWAPGIWVANYESMHKLERMIPQLGGVVLDESSILKAYDGKTRTMLIEAFHDTQFRLACTATPSPNDVTELGNHAEFLGAMGRVEMLATFFCHDGGDTSKWRLKGHAEKEFWAWVRTWSICINKPSDMGYSDDGYDLPPLRIHEHVIDVDQKMAREAGLLFAFEAVTLSEQRAVKKGTLDERCEMAAKLVNDTPGQWLVFCDLNDESKTLTKAIHGAVEVTGSDTPEHKETAILDFADGTHRVLVSKSSIIGFGVNLQSCSQMVFVGSDHSYEKFHQAVRRCWRFGQELPVDVHLVRTSADGRVANNLERKRIEHEAMVKGMVTALESEDGQRKRIDHVEGVSEQGRGWEMRMGDCVELTSAMADGSVSFSVYSPPFASLYTYSDSDRDMGNCKDHDEFFEHYTFLLRQLLRVTKPGRLSSVHCMIMPTSKVRDGVIGLTDFPGRIIKAHEQAGWIYHSDVTIWKDPVTAMQRTKALGLLHKQLLKDSCMSRMGLPDRVLTFRKPGVNAEPVTHRKPMRLATADDLDVDQATIEDAIASLPERLQTVVRARFFADRNLWEIGDDFAPEAFEQSNGDEVFGVDLWQKWASPVWDDINPSDTLQYQSAREEKDERHICPLQLEVTRRCVRLWSNPGDLVFSPFAGIGSEGHVAIQDGRRFLGCELKPSYYQQACRNLRAAESTTGDLFGRPQ